MPHLQDLAAIDSYVESIDDSRSTRAAELKLDWQMWFAKLDYYDKNFNTRILTEAKNRRTAIQAALNAPENPLITQLKEAMATKGPPPAVVKVPAGLRVATQKEITTSVLAFARQALSNCLPIGKRQASIINGRTFEAITEWHYDNHVPNKTEPGAPFWHPGITIYTQIKPLPKPANLPSVQKVLKTGQQVVAYDPLASGRATSLDDLMAQADSKVV